MLDDICILIVRSETQHDEKEATPNDETKLLHYVHACNFSLQFTENFLEMLNKKETTLL